MRAFEGRKTPSKVPVGWCGAGCREEILGLKRITRQRWFLPCALAADPGWTVVFRTLQTFKTRCS